MMLHTYVHMKLNWLAGLLTDRFGRQSYECNQHTVTDGRIVFFSCAYILLLLYCAKTLHAHSVDDVAPWWNTNFIHQQHYWITLALNIKLF